MSPSTRPSVDPDRQLQRKIEGRLQVESTWLQKLLFALGKVEEAREKLGTMQVEPLRPLVVLEDGTTVPISTVAVNVRRRVDEVMKALGQDPAGLPR
ncbi:MAG TPA: hypothetical protein VK960_10745 [Acidimicrobiia bacterium]|nr:hypothetical protein [Acidimicrobiia bacterium]